MGLEVSQKTRKSLKNGVRPVQMQRVQEVLDETPTVILKCPER